MRTHIIDCENDNYLIYLPDTLKFFKANKNTIELAKLIDKEKSFEEISQIIDGIEKTFYDSLYATLNTETLSHSKAIIDVNVNGGWNRYLPRLVLNISNDCNLRCRYCYAHGGNYMSNRTNMSICMVIKVLDTFYSMFDKIDLVQLFGGEPLMNIAAIENVAKYIRENNKDTQIGIITNGTLVDDKAISLIADNNIKITLSIDHRDLQNVLRPFANNNGTYSTIVENMIQLRKATSQPSSLEVVYTQEHIEQNISISDTLIDIQEVFGKLPIHLTRVCSDNEQYKLKNEEAFISSIDEINADPKLNIESDYSFSGRIISTLRTKRVQTNLCSAGFGTISVSVDGNIYPCFYFTDDKDFIVTNINESLEDVENSINKMRMKYYERSKHSLYECELCFANTVCYGCLGVNNSETGDPYKPSEIHCKLVKRGLERVLINLAYGGL